MQLSYRIMMFLLDGQEHVFAEFADHIVENIDPALAVRTLNRVRKGKGRIAAAARPLEEQVDDGCRLIVETTLRAMALQGDVEYLPCIDKSEWRNSWLLATPKGIARMKKNKTGIGAIFKELQRLYVAGACRYAFSFGNAEMIREGHERPPDDEGEGEDEGAAPFEKAADIEAATPIGKGPLPSDITGEGIKMP